MKCHRHLFCLIGICCAFASMLSSCAAVDAIFTRTYSKQGHATSVVNYLYPHTDAPIERPSIPRLELPLKVGVAFVPESPDGPSKGRLAESQKVDLMYKISREFQPFAFVKSIEIIPSDYLVYQGSFTNLDQIRTMHDIDVIALISYDQLQHTDQGLLSVTYWTLVGAYLFNGEKNDTSTMMDTVVYDIASRKMLFRAPGTSTINGNATPVNLTEQLREDAMEGFNFASEKMVSNLKLQLDLFQQKAKDSPEEITIVHRPGYTGGGSMDVAYLLSILVLMGGLACSRKKRRV